MNTVAGTLIVLVVLVLAVLAWVLAGIALETARESREERW